MPGPAMLVYRMLMIAVTLAYCYSNPYFPGKANKKCAHTKILKLLAADCHNLNLESVPQYLHGDVEILDLSFNRIRELRKKDFINYSYVKILYLGENFISHIETDTFGSLKYLEVVNMSLNAIHTIPPELFHLQNLRKLTMDHNQLSPENLNDLDNLPTMLSLRFLSLANCKLKIFPPLNKFPHIEFLNVSGNALSTISPSQIAPACMLTKIDLNGNERLFSYPSCNCSALKYWTLERNISVQPPFGVLCASMHSDKEEACRNMTLNGTNEVYSSCKVTYSALQSQATWSQVWLLIAIIAAIASMIILTLTCYWRCCRKRPPTNAVNHSGDTPPNQAEANKILLINDT